MRFFDHLVVAYFFGPPCITSRLASDAKILAKTDNSGTSVLVASKAFYSRIYVSLFSPYYNRSRHHISDIQEGGQ